MKTQKVIRGMGSLRRLPELMEKTGMRQPLIVGFPELAERIRKNKTFENTPVFSGFHANPDLQDAAAGARMYRDLGCDGIISIGGGSAMDTAKVIKGILSSENMDALLDNRLDDTGIPQIAVPGTAGTGAEATYTAVVYENGRKLSPGSEVLLPEAVILDAELLSTLPEYHRKSCALDALAQGIESYWSVSATADSRVHAYLAILGVLDNLKDYLAGDPHAAEEMLEASYQSGKAIRITRTTAAHAMSYQITKKMGYAHGHAVMLTLPGLWDMLLEKGSEENLSMLADLSSKIRLGHPLMGSRLLRGILYDLGLEIPAMPGRELLDHLVASVNPERLGNHPMKMTEDDLRQAYIRAFLPAEPMMKQACLDIWKYYGGQFHGEA